MPTATEAPVTTPITGDGLNDAQRAVAYIRVSTKEQAERGGSRKASPSPPSATRSAAPPPKPAR